MKYLPPMFSKSNRLLLSLFCIFLQCHSLSIDAQNLQFLKKKYQPDWDANPYYEVDIEQEFEDEDVVILEEKMRWKMNDKENSTLFHCNRKLYFASQEGIEQYQSVTIPESIDPSYEYADVPLSKRPKIHRPKYFNLEIVQINARIIKPDNRVLFLSIIPRTEEELLNFDLQEWRAFAYHFEWEKEKIEVGDIVEIDYHYFLPFIFDWRRIFFHGEFPKQKFELEISHPTRLVTIFDYVNGAIPHTVIQDQKRPYYTTRKWKRKSMEGCTSEVGARLHEDLPYITFYIHNKSYGDWENDHIVKYKPYTWKYFARELIGFKKHNARTVGSFTVNRKEWLLDDFYTGLTKGYDKHQALEKLQSIHSTITDRFGYQQDIDHYTNTDIRIGKLPEALRYNLTQDLNRNVIYRGVFNNRLIQNPYRSFTTANYFGLTTAQLEFLPKYLNSKTLRTISRNTIYQGVFSRLKKDYYQVHLSDKRVGIIFPNMCLPIVGDNQLFGINIGQEMHYIYPKKDRFGYALNELPFYLQDTEGLHIHQMTDSYKNNQNLLFKSIPQTKASENYRYNRSYGKVNLEKGQIDFEGEVKLSGQFSTLMRGFYLYGTMDSSINVRYAHHVGKPNEEIKILTQDVDYNAEPPFYTFIKFKSRASNLLTSNSDSSYQLNLKKWIYHIIHDDFEDRNRDLPYYPDFQGRDTYTYQLEFNHPITTKDFKDLPLVLENNFAKYVFNIEQQDDYKLLIRSDFTVKPHSISPKDAKKIELIYRAIQEVEKAEIVVKLKTLEEQ